MKQYLDQQQTAKLIELGFEKHTMKNIPTPEGEVNEEWYSIGELIEMLGYDLYSIQYTGILWIVKSEQVEVIKEELIDALYDMVVKLKEEGII